MSKITRFKTQKEADALLKGKTVTVIANHSGHGHIIGSKIVVSSISNTLAVNPYINTLSPGGYCYLSDISCEKETVQELEKTIESLNNYIKDTEKEILLVKSKIAFMKENKLEEYDDNTFKAFHTLSLLDDKKLTKIAKARLISELISG